MRYTNIKTRYEEICPLLNALIKTTEIKENKRDRNTSFGLRVEPFEFPHTDLNNETVSQSL